MSPITPKLCAEAGHASTNTERDILPTVQVGRNAPKLGQCHPNRAMLPSELALERQQRMSIVANASN